MNANEVIYKRFILPLKNKKRGNVGVELEFPLINLNKEPVSKTLAIGYLNKLVAEGFAVEECDTLKNPAFVVNEFGDCVSFDNSYNNIEFSMNYGDDLGVIARRFYDMYKNASDYFSKENYIIAGMGSNLYKKYTKPSHVSYPVYNMVDKYLHSKNAMHDYPDFPAYLSSVQTHLDYEFDDVPRLADLFSKIDFAAAYIFSNSLSFDDTDFLCMRDYLWENSAFGLLAKNTGSVNEAYRDISGLLNSYLDRSMFNRIRNGEYEIFPPVSVLQYFNRDDAAYEDIKCYLSFRNIEVTSRGTVEVRSSCAQPLKDAFLPPAFYLGLSYRLNEAERLADDFFEKNNITKTNSQLRKMAVKGEIPECLTKNRLQEFLFDLAQLSKDGLISRGKGEEVFLKGVFDRIDSFTCPALEMKKRLNNGEKCETIIKEFSKI